MGPDIEAAVAPAVSLMDQAGKEPIGLDAPVAGSQTALRQATRRALVRGGSLAQADPGFVQREQQLALADAMAQAIDQRQTLVAEAGTGVGKTFAYLVPLLLSGRRALVSTATKSLQDSCSCVTCRACATRCACRCALPCSRAEAATCACTGCRPHARRRPCLIAGPCASWPRSRPGHRPPAAVIWPRWTDWTSARQ